MRLSWVEQESNGKPESDRNLGLITYVTEKLLYGLEQGGDNTKLLLVQYFWKTWAQRTHSKQEVLSKALLETMEWSSNVMV